MNNVMLFSIIKICILITTHTNSMGNNKADSYCGYHGARCFPFQKQPCCEKIDQCQYTNGYFICIETVNLDTPCVNNLTCALAVNNAICDESHRCACKYPYKATGIKQCALALNAPCVDNESCAPSNSKCIDGVCKCEPNFVQHNSKCQKKYSDEPCQTSTDCSYYFEFSNCSPDKKCICNDDYLMYNKTLCVPTIDEICMSTDDCSIENSICIDSTCQCKPEYLMSSRGQCIAVLLIQSCYKDADCNAYDNSYCSNIGKCFCNSNLAAIEKNSCVPKLGDYCRENHSCTSENSVCIDNTCQSKVNSSKETLGGSCQMNSDCNLKENLKCSENNVCICKDNFTSFSGNKCKVLLNGFCTNYKQCGSRYSDCINNKCQCRSKYMQISTHQCLNFNDVYSCVHASDCGDPWHADCNDGKCVCKQNHIAVNNATCYPLLGGICWSTNQCVARNSECVDFNCKCKQEFIAVFDSLCIYKR